jgi:hypothetical protein
VHGKSWGSGRKYKPANRIAVRPRLTRREIAIERLFEIKFGCAIYLIKNYSRIFQLADLDHTWLFRLIRIGFDTIEIKTVQAKPCTVFILYIKFLWCYAGPTTTTRAQVVTS